MRDVRLEWNEGRGGGGLTLTLKVNVLTHTAIH